MKRSGYRSGASGKWGVDYIKVDDMNNQENYHRAEVEGYRKAIDN